MQKTKEEEKKQKKKKTLKCKEKKTFRFPKYLLFLVSKTKKNQLALFFNRSFKMIFDNIKQK